ncbi:MAG: hypothetical protein ACKVS5_11425 [Parvularculaceae bacterium]
MRKDLEGRWRGFRCDPHHAGAEIKIGSDSKDQKSWSAPIVCNDGVDLLRLETLGAPQESKANAAGDEKTGVSILRRALSAPTRQIAENSNVDAGVVVARMANSDGDVGFDAA